MEKAFAAFEPMYLKTIKVQHYKSLGDVAVDFEPGVTVIVGPNGVGKSNFVDVLRFLHDVVDDDLEHAVTKREGIGRLLQSYKTKRYKIGIQCEFVSKITDLRIPSSLDLELNATGVSNYLAGSKNFFYFEKSGVRPNSLASIAAVPTKGDDFHTRVAVAVNLHGWKFCTIYPNTLKKPALPDRDNALMESGENWASVIKAMKRTSKGREALEHMYESMRAVIPAFIDVNIQTVGSYLVPLFNFRGEDEKTITSFDPVQLSDGTLRLFGILLSAYQLPRPQLLIIEEPEQTIYPAALGVLADVFKEISQTTQVILTTHSPHLVQQFKPEQIRVAVMRSGLTSIHPIHPNQMEAVNEGLISLVEFMAAEGLRPDETVPAL